MSNLTNPFDLIIQQAAENKQSKDATKFKKKLKTAGTDTFVLADVSSSMNEFAGAKRKIDILQDALVFGLRPGMKLIAFSYLPRIVDSPADLPSPSGSTALHLALEMAADFNPQKTLVISDGRPDNETAALKIATKMPGLIDVIYCGSDDDLEAIAFMQKLTACGGGRTVVCDITDITNQRRLKAQVSKFLLPGN